MHDSVAKSLHGMALASATLPTWIDKDPATARRHAMAIQQGAEQASAEARSLLVSLRQGPGNGELVEPLRALVEGFDAQHDTAAELVVEKVPGLDPVACTEVVKAVAEALENVARHARATRVIVKLTGSMTTAQVEVIDDGVGFDVENVPEGHFGIQGIRERMEAVSGELTLLSRPGHGTRLLLAVPVEDPARAPVEPAAQAGTTASTGSAGSAGQVR
jgi:signal transduction histidine kinase